MAYGYMHHLRDLPLQPAHTLIQHAHIAVLLATELVTIAQLRGASLLIVNGQMNHHIVTLHLDFHVVQQLVGKLL